PGDHRDWACGIGAGLGAARHEVRNLCPLGAGELFLLHLDPVSECDRSLIFAVATAVPLVLGRSHHETAGRKLAPAVRAVGLDLFVNAGFEARYRIILRCWLRHSAARARRAIAAGAFAGSFSTSPKGSAGGRRA